MRLFSLTMHIIKLAESLHTCKTYNDFPDQQGPHSLKKWIHYLNVEILYVPTHLLRLVHLVLMYHIYFATGSSFYIINFKIVVNILKRKIGENIRRICQTDLLTSILSNYTDCFVLKLTNGYLDYFKFGNAREIWILLLANAPE